MQLKTTKKGMLCELSNDEDIVSNNNSATLEDPDYPWLQHFTEYIDTVEQVLKGWLTIKWWGISFCSFNFSFYDLTTSFRSILYATILLKCLLLKNISPLCHPQFQASMPFCKVALPLPNYKAISKETLSRLYNVSNAQYSIIFSFRNLHHL
jgi:hypothetical protein